MRTEECLSLLGAALGSAFCTSPEKTVLFESARVVLVMATSYESDGRSFLASGDRVNALAGAWYGYGWLHFGICSGLVGCRIPAGCPFTGRVETLAPEFHDRLQEKTGRYARLLDTARLAIRPAPEPETAAAAFAGKVRVIAAAYAGSGDAFWKSGAAEEALARFSYGHGWIDAGVATGLFIVMEHRDLFTI